MSGPASGRHLSEGLSRLIADTVAKTRAATVHGEIAAQHTGRTAWMERLETEMAPSIRNAFGWILDEPNAPEYLKIALREASDPKHQSGIIQQIAMFLGFILQVAFRMGEPMTQSIMNDLWSHNPSMPLSPQEAALAVLKGWMSQEDGATEAAQSGVDGKRFDHMVKSAGNPPGPEELLALHRRGIIDLAQFEQGIVESHIRPEWFYTYTQRFYDPLGPGEAIAAAVQSQLDYNTARKVAGLSGMSGDDFDTMYRVHGNPPGPQEVGEMVNRGYLKLPEAQQAIRESRMKNKYVDAVLAMRQRIPPERSIVMMVAHGAISPPDGINRLGKLGFDAADASALVSEAVNRKHARTRDLAQTQIIALYQEGAIQESNAVEMLRSLGYDPDEAAWIMTLADTERERHFQQSAIAKVHTLYVGHKIERNQAGTDLDTLRVPPKQRDDLLQLWDLERTSNVVHLTVAQLSNAYQSDWITEEKYRSELTRMGYTPFAMDVLERAHHPGITSGQPKLG